MRESPESFVRLVAGSKLLEILLAISLLGLLSVQIGCLQFGYFEHEQDDRVLETILTWSGRVKFVLQVSNIPPNLEKHNLQTKIFSLERAEKEESRTDCGITEINGEGTLKRPTLLYSRINKGRRKKKN